MDAKLLGEFIEARLKQVGMTKGELATRLGIGRSTISNWTAGRNVPDKSLLGPVAVELGVSVDELMEVSGSVAVGCLTHSDPSDPDGGGPLTLVLSNQARILRELDDVKRALRIIEGSVRRLEESRPPTWYDRSRASEPGLSRRSSRTSSPSKALLLLKSWVEGNQSLIEPESLAGFRLLIGRLEAESLVQ